MVNFTLKHRDNVEAGDILKFKETGELCQIDCFYEEGDKYYALFGGFSVPKLKISSFFESTLVDMKIYN